MRIFIYYLVLFLVVFAVTLAAAPLAGRSRVPGRNPAPQTPWQEYNGAIRV